MRPVKKMPGRYAWFREPALPDEMGVEEYCASQSLCADPRLLTVSDALTIWGRGVIMPFFTVRVFLVASSLLFLPCNLAFARQPISPSDAEVRETIHQLEQTKDQPARLQALAWLQNHADARNVRLAIPVLERTIRGDQVSRVREKAVLTLFHVAKKQQLSCPLALVQAIFDPDKYVRQNAGGAATQFTVFAPGTAELALRGAWSEQDEIRNHGLDLLALAAPRDQKTLAVLKTARNDRRFGIRHNAHCYLFRINGRLDEYLTWLIRVQEDPCVLDPIPKDVALRNEEEITRNLVAVRGAMSIREWCEKRPAELAAALVQLLAHKSPSVRRGAARLIGATAMRHDLDTPKAGEHDVFEALSDLVAKQAPGTPKSPKPQQASLTKSKVAPYLEKCKARQGLEMLSKNDPDRTVRDAALRALDVLAQLRSNR